MYNFEARTSRPTATSFVHLFIAIVFASLLSGVALAQDSSLTDGHTPSGIAPGAPAGSYALSGFDNISPYSGHLNFRLPLMTIGGRGKAGYTMTLPIEQQWRVVKSGPPESPIWYPTYNWWTDLKPGYSPGVFNVRMEKFHRVNCEAQIGTDMEWYSHSLTRLTFTTPDGTEYEFRDVLNNGNILVNDRCGVYSSNRGHIWVTADGTSATLITDYDLFDSQGIDTDYPINPNPGAPGGPELLSGYLIMRDGTRYRIDKAHVTWIRDTNGNTVNFTYSNNGYGALTEIKDSINRRVTISYGNPDVITFKGFGGADRTIKIWGNTLGDQNPATRILRDDLTFPLKSTQELFPSLFGSSTPINPFLISAVELPDGRRYKFKYNYYGELARVELPTGGAFEYDWGPGPGANAEGVVFNYAPGWELPPERRNIYRRVTERRVYRDSSSQDSLESRMIFTPSHPGYDDPSPWTTVVKIVQKDAQGNVLAASRHYFYGSPTGSMITFPFDYARWDDGKEYQTEILDGESDSSPVLRRRTNVWQNPPGAPGVAANNPRIVETIATLLDVSPNLVSKQTFDYDQYNNLTDTREYGFGPDAPGPLMRRTYTSYLTTNSNQGYVNYATDYNIHIRSLPIQKLVYDASGSLKLQTDFIYDNYGALPLVDCSGIVQHDGGFHTGYGARGNLTEVIHSNPEGSPSQIHLHSQYDIAGNLVKSVDGREKETNFYFSDRFGSPDDEAQSNAGAPELAGGGSYAFPTKVTNALNHTAYTQYDYYLGKPVNSEDANGIVSSVTYNDALDRPTQGIHARYKVGSGAPAERRQTTVTYDDANRVITVTSDRDTFNDNVLTSKSYYDGLGRTRRGAASEGPTWIITDTQFDGLGRGARVSNPYRATDPGSASAPDDLWTETVYDSLGRAVDVETPDGAHVITQYTGNQVMVVDQAGKRRRSETDALGRLIRVTEDPGNLNYETYYTYDALGNLRVVTQHGQTRTFVYDSLSRLASATNPESGTVTYAYDSNGNLTERVDARGVKTTMTYDDLNRVSSKAYSGLTPEGTVVANATPSVSYFYDAYTGLPSGAPSWSGTPSKGRLIGVTYGTGSEGTYYKYDAAGRIVTNHQRQGASNFVTTYSYNRADAVIQENRGSSARRKNWTYYDEAGRIVAVQSGVFGGASNFEPRDLVRDISYTPFGGLQSETYGNGLIHSMTYNERLQPTEIRLGRLDNLESIFRIGYMYGIANNVNDPDTEITPAHNNGNIARVKYFVSGTVQYAQTFQYDPLNRLGYAVEHNNGVYSDGNRAWYQTFDYDRYGNRGVNWANTSDNADAANSALQLADFSEANNRITRAGYVYDAAGNLIAEPGKSYTYDGENRLVTATVGGVVTSQYFYDGNGRRVKKIVGGVGTRFEYGARGELTAERNDSGVVIKDYLYKGGELIATTKTGVSGEYEYATADHLGTPRAWTDDSGNLTVGGRHDYLPFGEELFAGVGTRTAGQGYGANTQQDGQRNQFAGSERDAETALDLMGARYYSSMQGRFTSADPLMASGRGSNPQTWNRYSYALNNPLRYNDPTGMNAGDPAWWAEWQREMEEGTSLDTSDINTVENIKRYKVVVQERGGGQVIREATVTIDEIETEYVDRNGNLVGTDPMRVAATAENTGNAQLEYSGAQLDTMANLAKNIVEVSHEKGVDPTITLGIARTETHMGMLQSREASPAKQTDVNPMQLSGTSGITPTTDLRRNIAGAIDVYNRHASGALNANLQIYNNQGGRAAYAATAEGHINRIRASIRINMRINGNLVGAWHPPGP